MSTQSKVIGGERVVYTSGAIMGFEFLEHVADKVDSRRTVHADSCNRLQTYTTSPAQSASIYGNVRIRQ